MLREYEFKEQVFTRKRIAREHSRALISLSPERLFEDTLLPDMRQVYVAGVCNCPSGMLPPGSACVRDHLWERQESKFSMSAICQLFRELSEKASGLGKGLHRDHRKLSLDTVPPTEMEECLVSASPSQGNLSFQIYSLNNPAYLSPRYLKYHQILT